MTTEDAKPEPAAPDNLPPEPEAPAPTNSAQDSPRQTPPADAAPAGEENPKILCDLDVEKSLEERVIDVLRTVFDPEIPVNIYELGLVYDVDVDDEAVGRVKVSMTLTSPACPVAGTLPGDVEIRIKQLEDVNDAEVELVWDPPWDKDRLSEAAKLQLGLM